MNFLVSTVINLTQELGPVLSIVFSAILGTLIIFHPALLSWIIGLLFIVAGIAILGGLLTHQDRYR